MKLSYFDLHCDTLYEKYRDHNCKTQVDREKTDFEQYIQAYAIWSGHGDPPDTAYKRFTQIAESARLPEGSFLAVEGAELLGHDLSRLETLKKYGVKYLTLTWQDENAVGGAWNTDAPLTEFGKELVKALPKYGIIPDLSHASDRVFYGVAEMTDVFIATHSNSRAICNHGRNLTDGMFKILRDNHSLVGVSLCPAHLREGGGADISDVMKHIEHYLSLGGEKTVCFGCDFDGTMPPPDLAGPHMMYKIADFMASRGYGDALIADIFFNNANNYFNNKG